MKNDKISKALGQIDEELIADAMGRKKKKAWGKWAAMAACLCLIATCIWVWPGQEQLAYDRVERVVYAGADYWVCTPNMIVQGESLYAFLGLPETIDESYAGAFLGYFLRDDTNAWNPTQQQGEDCAALYTFAPKPGSNVYILCYRGVYYPAVRHDSDGYHFD